MVLRRHGWYGAYEPGVDRGGQFTQLGGEPALLLAQFQREGPRDALVAEPYGGHRAGAGQGGGGGRAVAGVDLSLGDVQQVTAPPDGAGQFMGVDRAGCLQGLGGLPEDRVGVHGLRGDAGRRKVVL